MGNVRAAVKGLIMKDEKFLAIRQKLKSSFIWDLPGGRIEFGGDPHSTLQREIKEEVGMEVKIIKPIGMWYFFRESDGDQIAATTFLCRPKTEGIDLDSNPDKDEKISEFRWVTPEEFLGKIFPTSHESMKEMIKEYFKL